MFGGLITERSAESRTCSTFARQTIQKYPYDQKGTIVINFNFTLGVQRMILHDYLEKIHVYLFKVKI